MALTVQWVGADGSRQTTACGTAVEALELATKLRRQPGLVVTVTSASGREISTASLGVIAGITNRVF